jgi:3-methyladenine DNA glycosylase AlkD
MREEWSMSVSEVIRNLKQLAVPEARRGMKKFGIRTDQALGVSIPDLRKLAKVIGIDHSLALQLWRTGIHEARILASMIDDQALVTQKQMETWVRGFDSWDLCDQCCSNLFDKTPFAWGKATEWTKRDEEYVKRAGFAMMACLAVHDKKSADREFMKFYPHIKEGARDERNYVRKAVNWALRQIGKRNASLNRSAIEVAREIQKFDSKAARWIASDALRELLSDSVKRRLAE